MRERLRLDRLAQLVAVQRARRVGAEDALGQARERERKAQAGEQEAMEGAAAAEQDWHDLIVTPGFAPEYGQALAGRLVDADTQLRAAANTVRAAREVHERRREEWQSLEAQVRSSEGKLKRLERHARRRAEEGRVAELADRVTFSSSRS